MRLVQLEGLASLILLVQPLPGSRVLAIPQVLRYRLEGKRTTP